MTQTPDPSVRPEAPAADAPVTETPPAAPAPRRYYRVTTPNNPDFADDRYGYDFAHGELILPEGATTLQRVGASTEPVPVPVLPLFERELHYTVEEIPQGEPILPRATVARMAAGETPDL